MSGVSSGRSSSGGRPFLARQSWYAVSRIVLIMFITSTAICRKGADFNRSSSCGWGGGCGDFHPTTAFLKELLSQMFAE